MRRKSATWRARFGVRSATHGKHEKRIGTADRNWPDWYTAYIVAEQTNGELPS
jgi:hypothetical protein